MKKLKHLVCGLRAAMSILLRFDTPSCNRYSVKLDIQPQGNFYLVTQQYYSSDQYKVTNSGMATYGWHSNGHLTGIGCRRYLVCDPLRQLMYLENCPDDGDRTVKIYHLN